MEEAEFEAPTAQLFHKRFLQKSQLDVPWDLVRWKVRYLKAQYRKANDWLTSTCAGLQDEADGRNIEAKIAKMCPYYDQLRKIFGKRLAAMQPLPVEGNLPSPQLCPVSPAPEFEVEFLEEECVPATPSNAALQSHQSPHRYQHTNGQFGLRNHPLENWRLSKQKKLLWKRRSWSLININSRRKRKFKKES
ncbi:uncharacterized protein LOC126760188 [Bactrocera neohumeralis]|uniref:uncharacterized protein LOC126760188 n=1 Tax=Bactrocera neohumeralis TaxID=98809 RepID=UPI0021667FC0|nr:uncharacterized protein LOC126760188 [Bactrocera neohumeralis]